MAETRIVIDEAIVLDLGGHVRLVLQGQIADGPEVGCHVRVELPITEVTGRIDITPA